MDFAKWLKAKRSEKGWSQGRLGAKVGVTGSSISHWESGRYEPSDRMVSLLQKLLVENKEGHYTTNDIADKLGVSRSQVSSYMHNAVPEEIEFDREYTDDSQNKYTARYVFSEKDLKMFEKIHELRKEFTYEQIKDKLAKGNTSTDSAIVRLLKNKKEPSLDLINIESKEGELLVSSRDISINFNKRHDSVLRDIDNLVQEDRHSFVEMFRQVTLPDSYGREQRVYYMNRDGFALLAMGFTGQEALEWKLKYIEAFNQMERQLQQSQPSYSIDDPVARAQVWIREQKEKEELQLTTAKQEQIIGELKPSADYTDTILQTTNTLTITQIAKDYDMTAQGMNKLLHKFGVQYKIKGQWVLYQHYQGRGFTKSYTHKYEIGNGQFGSAMSTEWTQKGRLFLYNLLKDEGITPIIEH